MNRSSTDLSAGNGSKMAEPDVPRHVLRTALQTNGTSAAVTQASVTRSSGIIPGAIAATVFITFLLALYAVLWKCMVSPPQRKHSKVRVRIQQRNCA